MKDFSTYRRALFYAEEHYDGLRRKTHDLPYVVHPLRAVAILRSVGYSEFDDENLMIAALFHDLIEDTSLTYEDIKAEFNEEIARLVLELSHPEGMDKEDWLKSLKNVSKKARIIKMADRIDNLLDMGNDVWSKKKQKSYTEQSKLILESCGDANPELARKLQEIINKLLEKLKDA